MYIRSESDHLLIAEQSTSLRRNITLKTHHSAKRNITVKQGEALIDKGQGTSEEMLCFLC